MPAKTNKAKNNHTSALLLRSGLAIVFLYAAVSSFKDPLEWAGYLPHFLLHHFNAVHLVKFFALYELILVAWLISGYYIRWAGLLCAVTLLGIVATNGSQLIVTFRDIGLAFMAMALAFDHS